MDKDDLYEEIAKLETHIRKLPPERRAYLIIKGFLDCGEHSEESLLMFWEWLIADYNRVAKDEALRQIFDEIYISNIKIPDEV